MASCEAGSNAILERVFANQIIAQYDAGVINAHLQSHGCFSYMYVYMYAECVLKVVAGPKLINSPGQLSQNFHGEQLSQPYYPFYNWFYTEIYTQIY